MNIGAWIFFVVVLILAGFFALGWYSQFKAQRAQPAPPPPNSANGRTVIFSDHFADNHRQWSVKETADLKTSFDQANGRYIVKRTTNGGGWSYWYPAYIAQHPAYQLSVTVTLIGGAINSGFGLNWNVKNSGNRHLFLIKGNGQYTIGCFKEKTWHPVVDWRHSADIVQGHHNLNHLQIQKIEQAYHFLINGRLQETIPLHKFVNPLHDTIGLACEGVVEVAYSALDVFGYPSAEALAADDLNHKHNTQIQTAAGQQNEPALLNPIQPIFQADFSGRGEHQWPLENSDITTVAVGHGALSILNKERDASKAIWHPAVIAPYKLYEISITLVLAEGALNSRYGLAWGLAGERNFIAFDITGNGSYQLGYQTPKDWLTIANFTKSEHINSGLGVENTLTVRHLSDETEFVINGEVIHTVKGDLLDDFPQDSVGVRLYSYKKVLVKALTVTGFDSDESLRRQAQVRVTAAGDDNTLNGQTAAEGAIDPDDTLEKVLADIDQLIGMDEIKASLRTLVNLLKVQQERQKLGLSNNPPSLHTVFKGPPGTGKTTIARYLGRVYKHLGFLEKGHLIEVDRADLVGQYIGHTAIKTDEKIREAMGGILFIDEAYSLAPEDSPRDFGSEAIDAIVKRMEDDRSEFAVVIAGYPEEMERFLDSNPGIKSRFSRYFDFDHYPPGVLLEIYLKFCREQHYTVTDEAKDKLLEIFIAAYKKRGRSFGNGRYARNLFEATLERHANRVARLPNLDRELLTTIEAADIPPGP